MRTRAVLGGIFGSVAVLAIGWQAGAAAAHNASAEAAPSAPVQTDNSSSSGSDQSITPPTATTPAPAQTSTGSSTTTGKSGTFTGDTVDTQFGPVQVKITVKAGKLTDVTPLQLTTDGGRSVQISNYAAPILRSEVLAAQSAKVSSVGGATYTSQGYLSSLQSALDKAGL